MRNLRIRLLQVMGAACALCAGYALAATDGTVDLSGSVSSSLAIVVSSTAGAITLPLDGQGNSIQHIVKVADLAISTNNEQGFLLTSSSASLTKQGGTSIAYKVTSVVDNGAPPESGDFLVASGSNYTASTAVAGSGDRDLYIMYTPANLQDAGTYSSTINLTVADN